MGQALLEAMDLDVVIVSHGDGSWLKPCLDSLEEKAGQCAYRTTIVENGGSDHSLPEGEALRVLYVPNEGFAAANNRGAHDSEAEILLFLNPDTELLAGTLQLLVETMRERPRVGLVAARQTTADGELWPSLHRFPTVRRALAQALASEKWSPRLGERVLEPERYAAPGPFEWTTGAVLAVRRSAFEAVGGFDERFFLFSEETDLCKRLHDAGWEAYLEPRLTFVHHAEKAGVQPRREAQMAYARLQYAAKHFGRARAAAYHAILVSHHLVRYLALSLFGATDRSSAEASKYALAVLLGRSEPPFAREQAAPSLARPRTESVGAR